MRGWKLTISDMPVRASIPLPACRHDELENMLMLRQLKDMPVGTIGFEAVGEVEDDDWEDTVEPVLRQEIAEGRKVRLLYVLGPESREVEGDALKADTGFRARHAGSFDRVAVVSDEDWIRPGAQRAVVPAAGQGEGLPGPRSRRGEGLAGRRSGLKQGPGEPGESAAPPGVLVRSPLELDFELPLLFLDLDLELEVDLVGHVHLEVQPAAIELDLVVPWRARWRGRAGGRRRPCG